MIRKAYFGTFSLVLLILHLLGAGLHLAGIIPYFYTLFYPMFALLAFLMAVVGYFEKDKMKWPSIVAGLASLGFLVHWVVALISRMA